MTPGPELPGIGLLCYLSEEDLHQMEVEREKKIIEGEACFGTFLTGLKVKMDIILSQPKKDKK